MVYRDEVRTAVFSHCVGGMSSITMQHIIFTKRLKLTLIEKAERGSQELQWLHELKSDERAQWWR